MQRHHKKSGWPRRQERTEHPSSQPSTPRLLLSEEHPSPTFTSTRFLHSSLRRRIIICYEQYCAHHRIASKSSTSCSDHPQLSAYSPRYSVPITLVQEFPYSISRIRFPNREPSPLLRRILPVPGSARDWK